MQCGCLMKYFDKPNLCIVSHSISMFNIVVDAVIWHWVTLVYGEEDVPYDFRQAVQCLAVLFYVDDRLLDSPRPARLQAALDVLTGLFDTVGYCNNANKTVGVVCQTYQMAGGNLEAAYQQRVSGFGPSFQERQR